LPDENWNGQVIGYPICFELTVLHCVKEEAVFPYNFRLIPARGAPRETWFNAT
jgi:hypothetical protein